MSSVRDPWNLRTVLPEALRSIRAIGMRRTFSVVRSRMEDITFDLKHGTDTIQTLPVEQAGVSSSNREFGQRYQPTGSSALGKILGGLPLDERDVFVDFGCGKGRTLLLAARFAFRRIVGVEFSAALCEVARANVRQFSARHADSVAPEVVETDATQFALSDDETVFYFFHPFGEPVMRPVLANIEASLERKPRRAFIVYYLPVHRDLLDASRVFALRSARIVNGYECCIYQHLPASRA